MKKLIFLAIFFAFFFLAAKPALAVSKFRLEPASGTITIGETTPVKIVLDTGGDSTGAVLVILSFDPTKLSAGSSLTAGVFTLELVNTVNNSTGNIRFDAGSSTNQTGDNITVATINFSGKAAGTTQVTFTQEKAVNSETNQYLATDSTGGSYTVVAAGTATPTPTTTAGGTPTPTPTTAAGTTPTPTPTTTAGTTPTPTPTVSAGELPETGILTPTLLFLIGGGILLTFSFFVLLF